MTTIDMERPPSTKIDRGEIEDFLYAEAELIDDWRLSEWQALFTDDGRYEVAPIGLDDARERDPATTLFLIADDRDRIAQRALRILKKTAHAEFPRSRTRHLVSNVRCRSDGGDTVVTSCLVVYRIRRTEMMTYMGQVVHRLRRVDGALRILSKRIYLDLETLKPQGTISIIL